MHWNTAQLELRNLLVPSLRLAEGHRTQAQTPANRLPITTGSLGHPNLPSIFYRYMRVVNLIKIPITQWI
jgi:hypothetical protein